MQLCSLQLWSLQRHSHAPHGTDRLLWARIPEVGVERKVCGGWAIAPILCRCVARTTHDYFIRTQLPNIHTSALLSTKIIADRINTENEFCESDSPQAPPRMPWPLWSSHQTCTTTIVQEPALVTHAYALAVPPDACTDIRVI